MTKQELIESFDLKNVNKNNAIFDDAKLTWLNGEYINKLDENGLFDLFFPLLQSDSSFNIEKVDHSYIKSALFLLRSRLKKTTDIFQFGSYFFKDPEQYDEKAVKKHWRGENLIERLESSKDALKNIDNFSEENIEIAIRELADSMDIGAGKLIHPIRLSLTGFAVSPGLFEMILLLGKKATIRRIGNALEYLKNI